MTGSKLVELCSSAASTQRVGSTLDVMNDQVPTDCAEVEILVLMLRVPEHAAGVDLAFARSGSIDDCLFELMMPVSSQHVTLPVMRIATFHVPHKFRSEELRRNREPLSLASHV